MSIWATRTRQVYPQLSKCIISFLSRFAPLLQLLKVWWEMKYITFLHFWCAETHIYTKCVTTMFTWGIFHDLQPPDQQPFPKIAASVSIYRRRQQNYRSNVDCWQLFTVAAVVTAAIVDLGKIRCKGRAGKIQYKCLVPIYVFPEMKLLFPKQNYNVPSSYTHISVRDVLYIQDQSAYSVLQGNMCRPILGIYLLQTHECGNWDWSMKPPNSQKRNT